MKTKTAFTAIVLTFFFAPLFAFAYTISNTPTGGDCVVFGTWNDSTCTLTQNITGPVTIGGNNIILDGAGFTISEAGITAQNQTDITVKNVVFSNTWAGIYYLGVADSVIENNQFKNTQFAIITRENSNDVIIKNNATLGGGIDIGNSERTTILNNHIVTEGSYPGIMLSNYYGTPASHIVKDNIIESHNGTGQGISAPQFYGAEITGNKVSGFDTGVSFGYCSGNISFRNNVVENNKTGLFLQGINKNTIIENDFIENATQSVVGAPHPWMCGGIAETDFSLPYPIGGNYWSNYDSVGEGCFDSDSDGFCDDKYIVGSYQAYTMYDPITYFYDNLPRVSAKNVIVVPPTIIALTDPTVTEDDGLPDGKGVAEKTKFTFSVTASEELIDIKLVTDSSDIGINPDQFLLYASGTEGVYSRTLAFPKGHYRYHFEAGDGRGGVYRYPETIELEFTTGYSNVAFLPGIKASRLFKQGNVFEDQLWEPNWWTDTNELMMNQDGTSEEENIYAKTDEYQGTIDQANILPGDLLRENFYVGFLDFMKEMKENGDIADWKALPYDWRLAFPAILNQGNATVNGKIFYDDRYATTTPYILQEIRHLAETSDTGKVTIIGHSMGGMLAKKILHDYQDIASSTDILILVDSPQLGTPQAIATMLHGTNENIPNNFGFFSDAKTGRKVAQNMKSVYTLLPSREYASHVGNGGLGYTTLFSQNENLRNITDDPLWNANSVLDFYQTKYGTTTISTYDGMKDFLGGTDGHVSAPDNDIVHPKRIQMDMLAEAQAIHDEIDNWVPPAGMRVVQIAGWGIPETIRGIEYKAKTVHFPCAIFATNVCSKIVFDTAPMFTFDGDGTVTLPSQMAMNTETYFVDLNEHNSSLWPGLKKNREHGSVLEVDSLRDLIKNLFRYVGNPAEGLDFIKTDKSQLAQGDLKDTIRLSLHSPVKIDITDQNGNHIGVSASSTPERTVYDTQMPNSYYLEMGEGKYLGFPLEASTTIQLQGTGTGTFTLNLEQYQGDTKEGTQTFTDIPVSTTTRATLVINTLNDAKELALDQDGNGTIDSVVFTDENKETVTFQTLKTQIQALTTKTKPVLLIEVAVAEKQFNKGNYKAAKALLLVLKKEIEVLSKQKIKNKWQIEKNDALRLFAILDVLIEKVDMNIPKK